jgi:hypothetical protein
MPNRGKEGATHSVYQEALLLSTTSPEEESEIDFHIDDFNQLRLVLTQKRTSNLLEKIGEKMKFEMRFPDIRVC